MTKTNKDPNGQGGRRNTKLFFPDYNVVLPKCEQDALKLQNEKDARVLVIVVMSSNPADITANLMGPVLINSQAQLGKQLVLSDSGYPVRKRLLPESFTQITDDAECAHCGN